MTPAARDEFLADAAERLGCALDDDQRAALLGYLDLLTRWNRTYNLTAIRDPDQMLVQHLADCLATVPPLQRFCGSAPARIADVGSGAGLPAVVLAIARTDWTVLSVDAVAKKSSFVQQVVLELGITNLSVRHARVESLREPNFNIVISRAFSQCAEFVRLSRHLLAPGGAWAAMKAHFSGEEASAMPSDVEMFHVEQLEVPGLEAERCLVWIRPRPEGHSPA